MPAIAGRTQRQLRAHVLYNCGAILELTATATGLSTTFVTNQLPLGAADEYKGWYIWPTSGSNNSNLVRRVTGSSVAANVTTLTFAPALTDATAANDTFQLIGKPGFQPHPDVINGFLNQALIEVAGLAYDPEESFALHGDGRQRRFDVPSEFKMVNGVWTRDSVASLLIHDAATEWDEQTISNVTRAMDTEDKKFGAQANRFTIAGAFATGVVASKAISALDLRGMTHVEFWIKSSTATVSGDFTLLLDDTALAGSALETLTVPALVAREWQFVRVALANPELDSAIISVALNGANNIAANVVWISNVRAVNEATAEWNRMDKNNWRVDEEARDLVFYAAPSAVLLKLTGGDTPALFASDSSTTEVDDQFLIARATELTLLSQGGGPQLDPDQLRALASYWHGIAEEAKRSLPPLVNVRVVS